MGMRNDPPIYYGEEPSMREQQLQSGSKSDMSKEEPRDHDISPGISNAGK